MGAPGFLGGKVAGQVRISWRRIADDRGSGRVAQGALALLLALSLVQAALTVRSAEASGSEPDPTATAHLIDVANAQGALGVYFRGTSAVVVFPSDRSPSLVPFASSSIPVEAQVADVTQDLLGQLKKDLVSLRATIAPDVSYSFFFDLPTATMLVQTDGTADDFATLLSRYGHQLLVVSGSFGLSSGRQSDTSPFWGGARIVSGTNTCTSGFLAKSATTTYMSTAGHCFATGSVVKTPGGLTEGTVGLRDYPTYEAEFYSGGSYGPTIYSGATGDDSTHIQILGRRIAAVAVGQTGYCRTGWNSGNVCDWKVGGTNATFCETGGPCTYDLYAFDGTVSIGGDSGGPVYRSYNGGALIVGTIVGWFSSPLGTINYAEKMGTVMTRWNLTQVCASTCVVQ